MENPQADEKCRIEYMDQYKGRLTVVEFTFKFETDREYCGLDKKGYCLSVPKADFIAWHPVDERSELDIAKEKQIINVLNAVNHSEYLVSRESVRLIQDQGMLAEIVLPLGHCSVAPCLVKR